MCIENTTEAAMATKDQERGVLQQIKALVADLGLKSYIAAFRGVFAIAEENIENDFSGNPVDHAQELGEQLAQRTVQVGQLAEERDEYKARAEAAEAQLIILKAKLYDYMTS